MLSCTARPRLLRQVTKLSMNASEQMTWSSPGVSCLKHRIIKLFWLEETLRIESNHNLTLVLKSATALHYFLLTLSFKSDIVFFFPVIKYLKTGNKRCSSGMCFGLT